MSVSERAQSLHDGLLGNALHHIDRYMNKATHELPIGEFLETHIGPERPWPLPADQPALPDHAMQMEHPSASQHGKEVEKPAARAQGQKPVADMSSPTTPKQTATIIYYGSDCTLRTLPTVDLEAVSKRCPLLAIAFEESRSGPQLFLETLSSRTADPFVRFLHTGSYAEPSVEWNSGGRYEDVPTSVLLHCEMFQLGDIYDLPAMKSQAYVNVLRQCEFGCSSPDKPIDLCPAIRFVYTHLHKQEQLIDALVNYCVACFLCHQLAKDAEFQQLAYELRPFHQDLCKNCMDRGFENETAAYIIQMPFEPHRPETYASTEDRQRFDDVVFRFHATDDMDTPKKKEKADERLVLPFRPASDGSVSVKEVSKPEDNLLECFDSKRRESSSGGPIRPAMSGDEFEEIDLEAVPEKAADSDTDSFEWVDVLPKVRRASESGSGLALRPGQHIAQAKTGENESDSDWSLV